MKPIDALATSANEWDLSTAGRMADDPLLRCLVTLTTLHNKPVSADTLIAGLPLVESCLTPELFIRAAARVGFAAKLVKRALEKIPALEEQGSDLYKAYTRVIGRPQLRAQRIVGFFRMVP